MKSGTDSSKDQLEFSVPILSAAAVGVTRRIAREWLTTCGLDLVDPAVDSALVILSELVTNVHKHARAPCGSADVVLSLRHDVLEIAVHDRNPHRPRPLLRPHSHGCGGRGLRLVHDLAVAAGGHLETRADPDGRGKTLLATVRVGA